MELIVCSRYRKKWANEKRKRQIKWIEAETERERGGREWECWCDSAKAHFYIFVRWKFDFFCLHLFILFFLPSFLRCSCRVLSHLINPLRSLSVIRFLWVLLLCVVPIFICWLVLLNSHSILRAHDDDDHHQHHHTTPSFDSFRMIGRLQ